MPSTDPGLEGTSSRTCQLMLPGPQGLFVGLGDASFPLLLRVEDLCAQKRPEGTVNDNAGCGHHQWRLLCASHAKDAACFSKALPCVPPPAQGQAGISPVHRATALGSCRHCCHIPA